MTALASFVARRSGKAAIAAGVLVLGAVLVVFLLQVRAQRHEDEIAHALTGGDPARAPLIVRRFGCGGCHTIPGIRGADGQVAPALEHLRQRVFIGGVIRNSPQGLVRWIVMPQQFSPHSAMPATGIDSAQARDVAAYLYAH